MTTGIPNGFQNLAEGKYYIHTGDLCVIAENTCFKIHSHFLTRESQKFREVIGELQIPETPKSATERATTKINPIVLDDTVKASHFASLLSVFYPENYMYEKPAEEWSIILGLAMKWSFDQVKELCIRELSKDDVPVATRLAIFEANNLDTKLTGPLYGDLCASPLPLTLSEMERLGIRTSYIIMAARERLRSSDDGGRSPLSPDRHADVEPTLRSVFKSITTTLSPSSSSSVQKASATQGTSGATQPTTSTGPASKHGGSAHGAGTGRTTGTTNSTGGGNAKSNGK